MLLQVSVATDGKSKSDRKFVVIRQHLFSYRETSLFQSDREIMVSLYYW